MRSLLGVKPHRQELPHLTPLAVDGAVGRPLAAWTRRAVGRSPRRRGRRIRWATGWDGDGSCHVKPHQQSRSERRNDKNDKKAGDNQPPVITLAPEQPFRGFALGGVQIVLRTVAMDLNC